MNVKDLDGIAVVSIAGGEKLGKVEDVVLDTSTGRVGALKLESGGLLRREHCYVPFAAVASVGSDAVMVPDATVVQPTFGERPSGYHTLSKLGDVKVVDEAGEFLGTVASAHIDTTSGAVLGYEVSRPGITGALRANPIVDAAAVVSFGEQIMVVPANRLGEATA